MLLGSGICVIVEDFALLWLLFMEVTSSEAQGKATEVAPDSSATEKMRSEGSEKQDSQLVP